MKYRRKAQRLERRRRDFDATLASKSGFKRPGSLKK